MNIFLDDYRKPTDCTYMPNNMYYSNSFTVVKDFPCFKDLIEHCKENNIAINSISFDHDLKEGHYGLKDYSNILKEEDFTGYHACKYFLEQFDIEELENIEIRIHTMSSFGAENIKKLLEEYGLEHKIRGITPYIWLC